MENKLVMLDPRGPQKQVADSSIFLKENPSPGQAFIIYSLENAISSEFSIPVIQHLSRGQAAG